MMTRYLPTNPVRADEVFWKTTATPRMSAIGTDWLYRRVTWRMEHLTFTSHILCWVIRWYRGTGKVDATQTARLRREQPEYARGYVVTTTAREMASFRLSMTRPDRERWDNQGGI